MGLSFKYPQDIFRPGPEVVQRFLCSTQLSTKLKLLIKTKIPTNKEVSCFKALRQLLAFNIDEQRKFRAQLN